MDTEIRIYFRMLAKGWWIIVICALLALDVALIASYFSVPIYRTSANFIITPNPTIFINEFDLIESLDTLDRRSIVTTYAEVFHSSNIYRDNIEAFGIQDPDNYFLQVSVHPDANIIELFLEGTDPIVITNFINSLGRDSISYIREIYQVYDIDFLDSAAIPTEPIKPNAIQNSLISIVFGLLVGVGLVLIREQLSVTLEDLRTRRMMDPVSTAFNNQHFTRKVRTDMAKDNSEIHSLGIVRLHGLVDLVDTLPPAIYNNLIRQAFATLKNELRGNDVVGRWNAISFAIFLPSTPQNAAERTMTRVQEALEIPVVVDKSGEFSIDFDPYAGVATRIVDEGSSELISRTEKALLKGIESNKEIAVHQTTPSV